MKHIRRILGPLTLAVALAGCGASGEPPAARPSAMPTQAIAVATQPPTVAPTRAVATAAPATIAPATVAPTQAPTQVPPTVAPTQAPTQAPLTAAPTQAPVLAMPTIEPGTVGAEILFLRDGDLFAYDVGRDGERMIVEDVREFAATPDAATLALVRGDGPAAEIWLVGRDGAGLRQLTANQRAERGLSWAPDGLSLAYASAEGGEAQPLDWDIWSAWCAAAEVRVLDLAGGAERTIGHGCDPAFAPDGRRIAFVSPPAPAQGYPGVENAIRIVNRQGANGWSFAEADGSPEQGMVLYAPAWSPDAGRLAFQRFIGYRSLVDITMTELGDSFRGQPEPIGTGAGWLLPPAFSPDGRSALVTAHNYSDARGLSGYEIWTTQVLRLGQPSSLAMPDGPLTVAATQLARVPRASAAAWSPDGAAVALLMPGSWEPGADPYEPLFEDANPGAIWRWSPAGAPEALLVDGVDFASPLAWLPPPPDLIEVPGVRLAIPRGWGLREPQAPGEIIADGGGATMAARGFNLPAEAEPTAFFPDLVPAGAELGDPISLPDGSIYRSFRSGDLAGAVRSVAVGEGYTVAALYRTGATGWPFERARAIALLVASGPAPSAQ